MKFTRKKNQPIKRTVDQAETYETNDLEDSVDYSSPFFPPALNDIPPSPDELIYAQELAKTPNQPLDALKRAGLKKVGVSARVQIEEYQSSLTFQAVYTEALTERVNALRLTEDKVVSHFLSIINIDKAELFEADGETLKNIHDIPKSTRLAISKIKQKKFFGKDKNTGEVYVAGVQTEMELDSRMDALKELRRLISDRAKPGSVQNNFYGSTQINAQVNAPNVNIADLKGNELNIVLKALGYEIDPKIAAMESLAAGEVEEVPYEILNTPAESVTDEIFN